MLLDALIDPRTRTPFLVVERLDGIALGRALPRHKPLPDEEAAFYTEHILRGLSAVHAAGMIHRDLKPQNVFLADRGGRRVAVLIDFGIGKLVEDGGEGLTTSAATLGSPLYMAPEQIGGSAHVDERCDVYAAATIAFRMLAGKLPFDDDRPMQTLAIKTSYEPPSLGERSGRRWPSAVEEFFATALARDPARRPRNGAEALEAWLGVGLVARPVDPRSALPSDTDDVEETPVLPRRRN
jgi:serine/threonine-protein kinase